MKTPYNTNHHLRTFVITTFLALLALPVSAKAAEGWSANEPTEHDIFLPNHAVNALLKTPWLIKYYHGTNPIRIQSRFVAKDTKCNIDQTPVVVDGVPRKPHESFARLEITAVEEVALMKGYAVSFRYPSEGVVGTVLLVLDGDSWRVIPVSGGEI